jgi:hypothetical protein
MTRHCIVELVAKCDNTYDRDILEERLRRIPEYVPGGDFQFPAFKMYEKDGFLYLYAKGICRTDIRISGLEQFLAELVHKRKLGDMEAWGNTEDYQEHLELGRAFSKLIYTRDVRIPGSGTFSL